MNTIKNITFTGPDKTTSAAQLADLSEQYKSQGLALEWGLLFSPARIGQGRYDSACAILAKLKALKGYLCAIHFCGKSVKQIIDCKSEKQTEACEDSEAMMLLEGAVLHGNCRIQLNFNQKRAGFKALEIAEFLKRVQGLEVILQHNSSNRELIRELSALKNLPEHQEALSRLSILFDASGGNGITPSGWPSIEEAFGFKAGYAGGLGSTNIKEQSQAILVASKGQVQWIDMENSLRIDDKFSPAKCAEVASALINSQNKP